AVELSVLDPLERRQLVAGDAAEVELHLELALGAGVDVARERLARARPLGAVGRDGPHAQGDRLGVRTVDRRQSTVDSQEGEQPQPPRSTVDGRRSTHLPPGLSNSRTVWPCSTFTFD